MAYNILIMGAAYGSLLASKMLFGGHKIHHVCLPAEADLINAEGFRVTPAGDAAARTRCCSIRSKLPGKITAGARKASTRTTTTWSASPCRSRSIARPGVRELLDAVGKSKVPCMSIMNMPPLPYVKRIPGLDYEALEPAYTDPRVWDSFDPK